MKAEPLWVLAPTFALDFSRFMSASMVCCCQPLARRALASLAGLGSFATELESTVVRPSALGFRNARVFLARHRAGRLGVRHCAFRPQRLSSPGSDLCIHTTRADALVPSQLMSIKAGASELSMTAPRGLEIVRLLPPPSGARPPHRPWARSQDRMRRDHELADRHHSSAARGCAKSNATWIALARA